MQDDIRVTARVGYEPAFSWSYLLPKYWGVWLGIFCLAIFAFVPFRIRDRLAATIGKLVAKKAKKQYHRAKVNLTYCFPQWSEEKREQVIEQMFITVAQTMLGIGEIALRSKRHLNKRSLLVGFEHLTKARESGKNIILLVPHTWAIDASGIILHTHGIPMTAMYNPHRNPLVDWLWDWTRRRFGGKAHARQNGIKPFLDSIRKGNMGYYLPDEDYGEKLSVYAPFFATYKATLPGLSKMCRVAKAVAVPMCPRYNAEKGRYEIEILAPLQLNDDPQQTAELSNQIIERFISATPEQYVWILRLLKTRKDGEDIYRYK